MFNMVRSKVTRIGGTLFVRIPAEEAKRLGLKADDLVDVEVRPLTKTVRDLLALRGRFKGQFQSTDTHDLWGDD